MNKNTNNPNSEISDKAFEGMKTERFFDEIVKEIKKQNLRSRKS